MTESAAEYGEAADFPVFGILGVDLLLVAANAAGIPIKNQQKSPLSPSKTGKSCWLFADPETLRAC